MTPFDLFVTYVILTGSAAASIRVARHTGKAIGAACRGEFKVAAAQAAAAVLAPAGDLALQFAAATAEVVTTVRPSLLEGLTLPELVEAKIQHSCGLPSALDVPVAAAAAAQGNSDDD